MELYKVDSIHEHRFSFRMTLGFSDQSSNTLSQYAVEVFNVRCFYIIQIWASINHSFNFINDPAPLFDFYYLAIIHACLCIVLWQHICIIVVSIRKYLQLIIWERKLYPFEHLLHHLTTGLLSPLSDRMRHKEVAFSFYACVYPRITFFICARASWLNVLLFFWMYDHISSTSN